MPFHLQQQGKGVFEIAGFASINWAKEDLFGFVSSHCSNSSGEPTSVLHMRRSPSPPTSASTLSSSFGGGGDTCGGGGVATLPPEPAAERKDEWASELQPIPAGFEAVTGPERCGLGGLEDWESMLSPTAGAEASPGQDQSLLRWISGDVDDPSFGLKQLLQGGGNPLDFDGNAGLGIVDQAGPAFDHIGGTNNLIAAGIAPHLGFGCGGAGFAAINNDNSNGGGGTNGKIGTISRPSSSGALSGIQTPNFPSSAANTIPLPVSLPMLPGLMFEEKPQMLNPQLLQRPPPPPPPQFLQNPNFLLQQQQQQLQPQPKRHNSGGGMVLDPAAAAAASQIPADLLIGKQQIHIQQQPMQNVGFAQGMMQFLSKQQKVAAVATTVGPGDETAHHQHHQQLHQQQQYQNALLDQLYKAAELVGTGNFSHAQGILARLNQQLSALGTKPTGTLTPTPPLHRAAFYFMEALQLLLHDNDSPRATAAMPTPFDVIFKMGAYKVFSEVSPLIQFVNFTSNQALLESLTSDAHHHRIHIVDFDIGFGAQWASFMQELPLRSAVGRGAPPSLKITAFASPVTHHHVELNLMRDNLAQFAAELGLAFELEVVNFDAALEQTSFSLPIFRAEGEAVAVNFPVWAASSHPAALPSLLRFVKQLAPKIVVSLDRGSDRTDLPFPQHIIQALHSHVTLLESLDAANATPDAVNKIEKFLLQPRIESTILGRLRAPDKMPLWKTLFASTGFLPVTFSNFTETQAECVVKRTPGRGFHVEKRQASLALCWQRRELISVSAWRC